MFLIGQAPGSVEGETGRPFGGPSGRRLFRWLAQAGWDEEDFRARCYISAVTKCFPGKHPTGRGDRVPTAADFAGPHAAWGSESATVTIGRIAVVLSGLDERLAALVARNYDGFLVKSDAPGSGARVVRVEVVRSPEERWLYLPRGEALEEARVGSRADDDGSWNR